MQSSISECNDYSTYVGYLLTVSPNTYKKWTTLQDLANVVEQLEIQIPQSVIWKKVFFEIAPQKKTLHLHTACLLPIDYQFKKIVSFIQTTYGLRVDFRRMPYRDAQRYASKYQNNPYEMEQEAHMNYINQSYSFLPDEIQASEAICC